MLGIFRQQLGAKKANFNFLFHQYLRYKALKVETIYEKLRRKIVNTVPLIFGMFNVATATWL